MRSPLPDSSNLEAGIVEDAMPSRLSRVHDNVRDLLRRSVFGSVTSTPVASPMNSPEDRVAPNPTVHPTAHNSLRQAAPIPSAAASALCSPDHVPGVLFPPWRPQPEILPTANPSSPESTPREHPDMNRDAMSVFLQQKERRRHKHRQQQAWKRPRSRKTKDSVSSTQCVVCSILGFAVFGLLGTYIALATTSSNVSALLHVLFVLALLLTSIVFIHTLVGLCCLGSRREKKKIVVIEPAPRRRRHRRHHEELPTTTDASPHYIPDTPIPVQTNDSGISDTPHAPEMCQVTDKGLTNPPPAYGSTTSSVRADPELLFWHAIPPPVEGGMPSPTYEDVVRGDTAGQRHVDREPPQV
ncbi:hypothetical protein MBLNU13_g03473t1 [Cladosporium sp. NU13]